MIKIFMRVGWRSDINQTFEMLSKSRPNTFKNFPPSQLQLDSRSARINRFSFSLGHDDSVTRHEIHWTGFKKRFHLSIKLFF